MLTFTYRGNMIIAVHYSTLVSQNRTTLYCPNVEVSRRLYKYFFHKSQIVAELYTMLYVIFYVYIFLFMHICSLMIFNSENKPVKILLCVLSKMLNIILKGFCNLSIDNQTIFRRMCDDQISLWQRIVFSVPGANYLLFYLGVKQVFTVSKIIAL